MAEDKIKDLQQEINEQKKDTLEKAVSAKEIIAETTEEIKEDFKKFTEGFTEEDPKVEKAKAKAAAKAEKEAAKEAKKAEKAKAKEVKVKGTLETSEEKILKHREEKVIDVDTEFKKVLEVNKFTTKLENTLPAWAKDVLKEIKELEIKINKLEKVIPECSKLAPRVMAAARKSAKIIPNPKQRELLIQQHTTMSIYRQSLISRVELAIRGVK